MSLAIGKAAQHDQQYVAMGRSGLLDSRVRGQPADLFSRCRASDRRWPSASRRLLDIHSLEELEMAAHDGGWSKSGLRARHQERERRWPVC